MSYLRSFDIILKLKKKLYSIAWSCMQSQTTSGEPMRFYCSVFGHWHWVIKGRFSISILGDTRKGKKTGMVCLPRFDQLYYCCPLNTCSLKKKCVFNLKTEQNKTLEMYVILTLFLIIKNVQPITGQRVFYYETDVVKYLQSSPFR